MRALGRPLEDGQLQGARDRLSLRVPESTRALEYSRARSNLFLTSMTRLLHVPACRPGDTPARSQGQSLDTDCHAMCSVPNTFAPGTADLQVGRLRLALGVEHAAVWLIMQSAQSSELRYSVVAASRMRQMLGHPGHALQEESPTRAIAESTTWPMLPALRCVTMYMVDSCMEAIPTMKKWMIPVCVLGVLGAAAALLGRASREPDVTYLTGKCVQVDSEEPVAVQIDGDPFGTTPVQFRLQPCSVPIVVPPSGFDGTA